MRKNNYTKNFKKYKSTIIISVVFVISLLFIGTGYSLLSQNLEINGTASASEQAVNIINGFGVNSRISDTWYNNFRYYFNTKVELVNESGSDTTGWKISMDVPSDVSDIQCWSANYELENERLTLSNLDYDSNVASGTSLEVGFILSSGIVSSFKPSNVVITIYTLESPNGFDISIPNTGSITDPENPEEPEEPEEPTDPNFSKYLDVSITTTNSWNDGEYNMAQYSVVIKNKSTKTVMSWGLEISDADKFDITGCWSANYILTDTILSFSNVSYNGTINPDSSVEFGMTIKTKEKDFVPQITYTKSTVSN